MSRRSPKRTAGQPGGQLNPLLEVLAHGLHHRHPRGHGPVVVPAAYLFGLRGFAWSDEQPDVKVQKTTIIFYKKCSWSWKYSVSHHLFHRPQFYIRSLTERVDFLSGRHRRRAYLLSIHGLVRSEPARPQLSLCSASKVLTIPKFRPASFSPSSIIKSDELV